jgi:hypothetical protein
MVGTFALAAGVLLSGLPVVLQQNLQHFDIEFPNRAEINMLTQLIAVGVGIWIYKKVK